MRILYDPEPRDTGSIFSPEAFAAFRADHDVVEWQGEDRATFYARHLPTTEVLISQQPMEADRLSLAPHLRAIFNVETNFLPNVDCTVCCSPLPRACRSMTPGCPTGICGGWGWSRSGSTR